MIGKRENSAGKRGITVPKIETIVKLEESPRKEISEGETWLRKYGN